MLCMCVRERHLFWCVRDHEIETETERERYIYIYIYIYVGVGVGGCVCIDIYAEEAAASGGVR